MIDWHYDMIEVEVKVTMLHCGVGRKREIRHFLNPGWGGHIHESDFVLAGGAQQQKLVTLVCVGIRAIWE